MNEPTMIARIYPDDIVAELLEVAAYEKPLRKDRIDEITDKLAALGLARPRIEHLLPVHCTVDKAREILRAAARPY